MEPHQERVVQELKELREKREKLFRFIEANPAFRELPEDEKERLERQHHIMAQYEEVLQDRILHFRKEEAPAL